MSSADTSAPDSETCVEQTSAAAPRNSLSALFSQAGSNTACGNTPWHLRGAQLKHEKRIGMAPRGTRRSMGKR